MADREELMTLAARLYADSPDRFTAGRTEAEKQAKAAHDKELAAAIKTLKRPSVGAWAVNVLVRRESEQIDQVLDLAASLREAADSLDGEGVRELTRQRRQLTHVLTTRARQLALESGARLTGAVADQVEATLTAAMLSESAAAAVRTGLLITTLAATGMDEDDFTAAVALPEAMGTRAAPAESTGPTLHVVPENEAIRREAARESLALAESDAALARRSHREKQKALSTLEGSQLQMQSEIEELQRRIGELETRLEGLDDDLQVAESARDEAADWLAEAEEAVASARTALDRLS